MALRSPAPLPPRVQGSPQRAGGAPSAAPDAFSGRTSAPARNDALVGRTLKVQKGPFRCARPLHHETLKYDGSN